MRIRLVCLEDGIVACGFRRIVAYTKRLNPDTTAHFVSTNNWRSLRNSLTGGTGGGSSIGPEEIDRIARRLIDADLIGFSSMTGYAELTRAVINRVRELSSGPYIIWGGIHPIIHPDDAIKADVDAICIGEGEFAFEEFLSKFTAGEDFTQTKNFWFKRDDKIVKNGFLPLMTPAEMETLPFPHYGKDELVFDPRKSFVPVTRSDYIKADGLGYSTIWSIGCPFHCAFCGNTKFIKNDSSYKKIRHPSARYIVDEIKSVRETFPHISTVCFHDDSFMALPLPELTAFAELWRAEVGIPFAVFGVIPNYVQQDKFDILTWAGMNRIRMGIQSGSERILDFYKRPTPLEKIEAADVVNNSFVGKYHIPPAYDMIMDNPVETRQDVIDTLELAYRLRRPWSLNLYSLKVIPNTELERVMKEAKIDLEEISENYFRIPPRWANVLLYIIVLWRPPRWLFDRWLKDVKASGEPQKMYPVRALTFRFLYLIKRALHHLRFMDFSTIPGHTGYICWRIGLVSFWRKYLNPRPPKPGDDGGATRARHALLSEPASAGIAE